MPDAIERNRGFAAAVDPIARRVIELSGSWRGQPLEDLAPVEPPPGFGFSSTPARPCLTRVTTTIVRGQ